MLQQLAIIAARFHALASSELGTGQKLLLNQRLQDNLKERIDVLADVESRRIRDRPFLDSMAEKSFQNELMRLRSDMVYGTQM